jgi:hypothetical protein
LPVPEDTCWIRYLCLSIPCWVVVVDAHPRRRRSETCMSVRGPLHGK